MCTLSPTPHGTCITKQRSHSRLASWKAAAGGDGRHLANREANYRHTVASVCKQHSMELYGFVATGHSSTVRGKPIFISWCIEPILIPKFSATANEQPPGVVMCRLFDTRNRIMHTLASHAQPKPSTAGGSHLRAHWSGRSRQCAAPPDTHDHTGCVSSHPRSHRKLRRPA